ncbi:aspartyl protease family protein [Rufibacter psychrotolerans]|uniref:aspartyl protease family protein n=1 Tax=Rufibacter psychrotolerans TaxID=2812556 RepID=UPI00196879D3|nr:retropepsin-like aspartic protease [Rufibacter sp. SYSU D00308]
MPFSRRFSLVRFLGLLLLVMSGSGFVCAKPAAGEKERKQRAGAVTALAQKVAGFSISSFFAGSDSTSCVIPFTRAGNLILIQATADTTVGNFILDTGAQNLVLNITYFRDYPTLKVSNAERTSVTGTSPTVLKTVVRSFSFGTLRYSRLRADLVNLGHIENSKQVKILGLLGMELFRQCEMIIDYERSLIYLHQIGRKEATTYRSKMLQDTARYHSIPIDLKDNRIIARTELAGKKVDFIIDCGAETNILDSRLPNKIFEQVVITGRVLVSGTGNKKIEALRGDVKDMRLGSQAFASLPVLITSLENTCFSYNGCINGVLGFDFLAANNNKIGFNFVKRELYIWK